jgi:hypothetical protein
MKLLQLLIRSLLAAWVFIYLAGSVQANVPIRISIKFILSPSGTRPATGNLNTDAEINGDVNAGNEILRNLIDELRIDLLELVDISGVSQYYTVDSNITNRDNLRTDAMNNPTLYGWRNDAINIYINGTSGGAISDFPPNNNIILANQTPASYPSVILHEIGHSLNLMHTHEGGGADGCVDTITDNANWTRDQIAQSNFGQIYANLTPAQQDQVDLVWTNVMSYHFADPQVRLSPCQMNRTSTQADSDRNRLLTKMPIYVDSGYTGGSESGRFTSPYKTLQGAVSAGGLSGKVLVLQWGDYTLSSVINDNVEMVTRFGASTVNTPVPALYTLPVDLENSKTPEVRAAIRSTQEEDNASRKVVRDEQEALKSATKAEDKATIRADAEKKKKQHSDNALIHLMEAEKFAKDQEKIAIHFELAQRYRDSNNCTEAIKYLRLVADATEQEHLKEAAELQIRLCLKELDQRPGNRSEGERR